MIKNRKLRLTLLTLLPGILFWLAWPPRDLFFLGFVAFVPLFFLEKETQNTKGGGWLMYASLLFWNLTLSWWVYYAEAPSSVTHSLLITGVMMIANALLMLLPWLGYRKARKLLNDSRALFVFITLWLAFEYLHLNWQITWPWFTLGNIFAKHNEVVQWYEITGTLGGSLWVLALNVWVYKTLNTRTKLKHWKTWFKPALGVIIPIAISYVFLFLNTTVSYFVPDTYEALLVQPNVDPNEKFDSESEISNLVDMLALVEAEIGPETDYVVMPETAVVEYVDEDHPDQATSVKLLKAFAKKHPNVHLITGISTYNWYDEGEKMQPTARLSNEQYYESYNTSMEVDSAGNIDLYHKSKLVPGAEKIPYPQLFSFLDFLALDLGGISGSLGSDSIPKNFDAGNKPNVAPLICYESVFPGYVNQFVRRGANIILVITNDGWWRDTDGYKQHMYYATLRAIENRREVLRSANTGISCRINRLGQITDRTEWWEPTVLKVQARAHASLTFYTKNGDYIGRLASFIALFFILGLFVKGRIKE